MAVSSVTPLRDGISAGVTKDGYTFEVGYRVETTGGGCQLVAVLAHFLGTPSLPWPGRFYSFDGESSALAICEGVVPVKVSGHENLYLVTASYKTQKEQEEQPPSPDVPPEDWSPKIRVRPVTQSAAVSKAIYRSGFTGTTAGLISAGDEIAPSNSCLVPFDPPPMREETGRVISITRWYPATTNLNINQNDFPEDVVNNSLNFITGSGLNIKLESYTGKLSGWTFEPTTIADQKVIEVSVEIHQKPDGQTWREELLDHGFSALATNGLPDGRGGSYTGADVSTSKLSHRPLFNKFGDYAADPVLLDGGGEPLSSLASEVFITYSTLGEQAFDTISGLSGIVS